MVQQNSYLSTLPRKCFKFLEKGKIRAQLIQGKDHFVKKFVCGRRGLVGELGSSVLKFQIEKGTLGRYRCKRLLKTNKLKKNCPMIFLE